MNVHKRLVVHTGHDDAMTLPMKQKYSESQIALEKKKCWPIYNFKSFYKSSLFKRVLITAHMVFKLFKVVQPRPVLRNQCAAR